MFNRTLLASALFALFSQSALAADKVRWLNDWLPAGDKAAIYLGVEQGLFAAEGIEVEIASARGGSDVVTKLATNSADFGSAGLASLLQAQAQGEVPVVAVAPIYNKQPDAFFTTEGSGIESFKDIVGKTVATPTFSASNVVWPLLLERNGIDPASVKLLKLDPGALAPMLATGKVDATINWLTVAPGFQDEFRPLFGDETQDYNAALQEHYANPKDPGEDFITAYATSHPHEDWAETVAHLLHMVDFTDSFINAGLLMKNVPDGYQPYAETDADHLLNIAAEVAIAINDINRALDNSDLYPFILTPKIREKIKFAHGWISNHAARGA